MLSSTIELREIGNMDSQQLANLSAIVNNRTLIYCQGNDGKYMVYRSQVLSHNMLVALAEYFKDKTFFETDLVIAAEVLLQYHSQLKSQRN